MKKLLLLMLLALPAYGQEINPWGTIAWKQYYKFLDAAPGNINDTTGAYIYAPGADYLDFRGASHYDFIGGDIYINNSPGSLGFEQPDGILYLKAPSGLDATYNVDLPMDSGRVDVHNVTNVGLGAFDGSDVSVTITIPGALSTDIYFLSQMYMGPGNDWNYPLTWEATDGALIVHRMLGGPDSENFSWRRFRQ